MSSTRGGQRAASRAAGDMVEHAVIQFNPALENVTDADARWYDARVDGRLEPSDDLPFEAVSVLEDGAEVEIKGAQIRLNTGQRGRFYIRRQQHERLLDAGAAYLLAVYDPRTEEIVAKLVVPASVVDDQLPDDEGWVTLDRDGRTSTVEYCQRAWSRFFELSSVEKMA